MPLNADRRKKLAEIMPDGIIASRKWLMKKGLSRHALDNLVKSQQLVPLSKGIYVRGGMKTSWESLVYSLQTILEKDLTIGGLTALEMQGMGHYLQFSRRNTIHLYGTDKLPGWMNKLMPDVTFTWHNAQNIVGKEPGLHFFTTKINWDLESLILSSPERAYMEVLFDVPQKVSFEYADQLMQGLTSLSPRKLQKLLELSENVKVKRLFLWFAERHKHVWLAKLDPQSVDMGSGNRVLVKGGKLDKKYKITVPESI